MTREDLRHKVTLLTEVLLSGLEARERAREAGSSFLAYISELLIERTRDELCDVEAALATVPDPPGRRDDQSRKSV
jgi:hypothetical protein